MYLIYKLIYISPLFSMPIFHSLKPQGSLLDSSVAPVIQKLYFRLYANIIVGGCKKTIAL